MEITFPQSKIVKKEQILFICDSDNKFLQHKRQKRWKKITYKTATGSQLFSKIILNKLKSQHFINKTAFKIILDAKTLNPRSA